MSSEPIRPRFTRYPAPRLPYDSKIHRSPRHPNGSRFDVRATYGDNHALKQHQRRQQQYVSTQSRSINFKWDEKGEDVATRAAEPTINDLFMRANVSREERQLHRMWRIERNRQANGGIQKQRKMKARSNIYNSYEMLNGLYKAICALFGPTDVENKDEYEYTTESEHENDDDYGEEEPKPPRQCLDRNPDPPTRIHQQSIFAAILLLLTNLPSATAIATVTTPSTPNYPFSIWTEAYAFLFQDPYFIRAYATINTTTPTISSSPWTAPTNTIPKFIMLVFLWILMQPFLLLTSFLFLLTALIPLHHNNTSSPSTPSSSFAFSISLLLILFPFILSRLRRKKMNVTECIFYLLLALGAHISRVPSPISTEIAAAPFPRRRIFFQLAMLGVWMCVSQSRTVHKYACIAVKHVTGKAANTLVSIAEVVWPLVDFVLGFVGFMIFAVAYGVKVVGPWGAKRVKRAYVLAWVWVLGPVWKVGWRVKMVVKRIGPGELLVALVVLVAGRWWVGEGDWADDLVAGELMWIEIVGAAILGLRMLFM
ncbi:unnamed protein product [Periconia digitata]|uniref:Uncharacterized protein n=1 Tax=Periconia digitata TaxID=1303443 RepID=A0A9W4XL10_9PLEO|nr:unnamed protein product [Periconia digitata]